MSAQEDPYRITSVEELRAVYENPVPLVLKSKLRLIDDHMAHFIRLAPFVCLASEGADGLDASPRGGEPGFVRVLDRHHVALADWTGNNKIETMTNIVHTGRCAMLFIVPKLDVFLRLNGGATLTRDPALRELLKESTKLPKTVVKLTVKEAYFHCGKAFRRSRLWVPDQWPDVSGYPTIGKVLHDLAQISGLTAGELDQLYEHALQKELY